MRHEKDQPLSVLLSLGMRVLFQIFFSLACFSKKPKAKHSHGHDASEQWAAIVD